MVALLILISIFITSCGNLYLEFNSDGIYETPMMRYEIKQVDDKLHIKMANISGDTVMKCDFIFFFQMMTTRRLLQRAILAHLCMPITGKLMRLL